MLLELALLDHAFGDEHPEVGEVLVPLARVLADGGDVKGAKAAAEEAVKIFRRCLPAGHWRLVEAEEVLGR